MITTDNVLREIEEKLDTFAFEPRFESRGEVVEVGDGVARIFGLPKVGMGEEVVFENDLRGQVIGLSEDSVFVVILGDHTKIPERSIVKAKGSVLKIGVSDRLLGRVINPLGEPLDGGGKIAVGKFLPIERIAPGVTLRAPVNTPLKTGLKAIDTMIPIGRGQRELIIGDRATGKTAIVLDTIINQEDVISIYVAIGQKQANVAQMFARLQNEGAMENTIIVTGSSSDPVSFQYIAPYVGCTIAEYFMEKGKDVLVVYDDLTKHAWAYRQIALILKRPSGREAYPGDIFYLHSRLLERACKLTKGEGGGSLTALPIVETQAGDISTYIPTNLISITDGQIYLESDLFYAGVRPAVNVGLSVSRVGGAAQTKKMKQVTGALRLELAQYRELSSFAQFGSDLDKATRDRLERGARITEILKQPQFSPMTEVDQVIMIWVVTNGLLDDLPVDKCQEFEEKFLEFLRTSQKKLLKEIETATTLSESQLSQLKRITEEFKESFNP